MAIQNFPIEIDIRPFTANAALLQTSTFRLAKQLGDMTEPLRLSVREVVIPSIIRNFAKGGRPPWTPLSEATLLNRAKEARTPRPLLKTELLARNATAFAIWRVTRETADMEALDRVVPYARFHQNGTRLMPARPFALLQPQDIENIVLVFETWIRLTTAQRVNWPFPGRGV